MSQERINQHAQAVLDMFNGENSGVVILSLLSVIECITENDNSTAAFRKQSVQLLEDQAFRIRSQMRMQGVNDG